MSTATASLADITAAEQDALAAATKAAHAAEVARQKADAARERAEQERQAAYKNFLDKVVREYPEARSTALTAAGESRAALEHAVRTDDGVFAAYIAWVTDSIHVWELDSELAQIRDFHGVPVRSTDSPVFSFGLDVGAIIDAVGFELQEAAVQRIVDRRVSYVNGRTA
jgi:hypothetical protein